MSSWRNHNAICIVNIKTNRKLQVVCLTRVYAQVVLIVLLGYLLVVNRKLLNVKDEICYRNFDDGVTGENIASGKLTLHFIFN